MSREDTNSPEAVWAAPTVYRDDLLKGQVVLVSGGGTGIGRAAALLFCRLGAQVVICGRTQDKPDRVVHFAQTRGGHMLGLSTNVREPEQVKALYARIQSEFGRFDGVINNAGGQYPGEAIDFEPKGWAAVINNNLNGTWYMMQGAARLWREQKRAGALVNIVVVAERGMPGAALSFGKKTWGLSVFRYWGGCRSSQYKL